MEYVYSALLLHAADRDIDEDGITSILDAAGIEPDEARVKALVSALGGVDVEDAIDSAAVSAAAAPAADTGGAAGEPAETEDEEEEAEDEDEEDEEEEVSEEEAAAGLGELF
jgi:large subunit ribosomal protein L12